MATSRALQDLSHSHIGGRRYLVQSRFLSIHMHFYTDDAAAVQRAGVKLTLKLKVLIERTLSFK